MDTQLEQIREAQKATWNKFSPGWKKWDEFNMRFLGPMGDAIIGYLQIKEDDIVLDLATGTGEPGLTIATLTPKGKVVGTDLAQDMLEIAATNAAEKNIQNYTAAVADTCELPFPDNTFDAISCRMGFMFFPDMSLAAREMVRVLKPGGRMSTSVWGAPQKNAWIGTMMRAVGDNIELPPPVPGAPGMFRCSAPGVMAGLFADAGFTQVGEKEVDGMVDYGTADIYWEMMMDVAAPVVAAMSRSGEETKQKIKTELYEVLRTKEEFGSLRLGYSSIVLVGTK